MGLKRFGTARENSNICHDITLMKQHGNHPDLQ
jgi:hypothetical protein